MTEPDRLNLEHALRVIRAYARGEDTEWGEVESVFCAAEPLIVAALAVRVPAARPGWTDLNDPRDPLSGQEYIG